jgi:phosphonate transport system substrate-binding protein
MNDNPIPNPASVDRQPAFRWSLLGLILLLAIVGGGAWISIEQSRESARVLANQQSFNDKLFGLGRPVQNRLSTRFRDEDGDLIADVPSDSKLWIDPNPIVFSYVAGKDSERQKNVWKSFTDQLAEVTGRKVEFLVIERQEDQLQALKNGSLHVAGLNTGAVPIAVNAAGFVPVSVLAKEDGTFGYRMQVIVPKASPVRSLNDVRGKRVHFLWRDSNSGFKAPVVILSRDFGLQPDVNYEYGFSMSHDDSIRGVLNGQIEIAPVASDMIDRMAARDGIDRAAFRSVYESERFPPAALGYLHHLQPELAAKIRRLLSELSFADTSMAEEFQASGVTRLIPVNFKDEWSIVRRIDDFLGFVHEIKSLQPLSK